MDENQEVIENVGNPGEPEKTLTQSQVNEIVGREKAKAAQIAKREAEMAHQRELEAINARAQQQTQRNAEVPRDVDANAMYQQLIERFNADMLQKQHEAEMSRVANSYMTKMQSGSQLYDDFNDVTADFDPTAFPQLTYLLAGIDNAADVLYDLAKNPMKLSALDNLAVKNPRTAQAELLKLANSITENKKALNEANGQEVEPPLDHLRSSRVSGSNGKQTIRDMRNQPWLRG